MTGWNRPRAAASLLGPILMLASAVSLAAEEPVEALPGAFLEFLADWEDERGEWQDPLEYQDPQWQALDERVGQDNE